MKKLMLLLWITIPLVFVGCEKEEEKEISSISFDESEISIKIGDSKLLNVIHYPIDMPTPIYSFEVEDANIATVDENGIVVGVSNGNTKITAYVKDRPILRDFCSIIVEHITPTKISMSENDFNLKVGDTKKLSYTIKPSNTTLKNVRWTSSNNKVLSIDNNGNVVAKAVGDADIKVEIVETDLYDICSVSVLPIPTTEINLEIESVDLIAPFIRANILVSKKLLMQAIVYPENATNKDVIFECSDNNVIEIEQHNDIYRITPKNIGFAEITAKTLDNITAKCELTVKDIDFFATIGLSNRFEFDAFGQHIYLKIHFDTHVSQYVSINALKVFDSNGNERFDFTGFPIERQSYTIDNIPISETYVGDWKAEIYFSWKGNDYIVRSK